MAQLFMNNASGKLAYAVDADDTTLVLESGQGSRFPAPADGDYFLLALIGESNGEEVTWEIVKATARVGDTLTVVRAQESTTAQSWAAETKTQLRLTAAAVNGKQDKITSTGILKGSGTDVSAATAGTDYVAPDTPSIFTATQTFKGIAETVYSLSGAEISPENGSIQYKTLTANTTFTEELADGQSVTLMLNPATYTVTWPMITWVGSSASTAPTLVASVYNCITLFQIAGVVYGKYVGRV